MSRATEPPPARGRSTVIAVALSFLWPGLGQWYLGRHRDALLYAIPVLALAAALALQFTDGLTAAAARLLDPSFSMALLGVIGILGLWRLIAIADAGLQPPRLRTLRSRAGGVLAVLAILVLGMHAVAGYYAWSFYDASTKIFVGTTDGPGPAVASPSGQPAPTDEYNVPPFATPAAPDARITMLLTGIDKTTERNHSLTDTLLIVSVDPTTGKTTMVSFPRDLAGFPLYDGGTYDGKINSLMEWAANHPKAFPDGPLPTLAKELGYLLGVPINYYAAVDIDGFQTMIDAVGGVTVTVNQPINDAAYSWLDGTHGFYLSAGVHHLDGRTALAFVRSRYSTSDFARASRQQQLLVALEKKVTDPSQIDKLPALLQAASQTIRTNFPPDRLQEMLAMSNRLDSSITQVVLQPPKYSFHPPDSTTGGTYTLTLQWDAVKALSVKLFGSDSAFWTAAASSLAPSAAP